MRRRFLIPVLLSFVACSHEPTGLIPSEGRALGIDSLEFNICLDDPKVATRTSCAIILDPSITQDPASLQDPEVRAYYSPGYLYRRGPNPNERPASPDSAKLNQKYVRWVFGRYLNRARAELCDSIASIGQFVCSRAQLVFTDSGVARRSDFAAIVVFHLPGYREIVMTVFSDVDSVADTLRFNIGPSPADSVVVRADSSGPFDSRPYHSAGPATSIGLVQVRRRTPVSGLAPPSP